MQRGFMRAFKWLVVVFILSACTSVAATPGSSADSKNPANQSSLKRVRVVGSAMEPSFHDGQVVIVEGVAAQDLKRGDVIMFTAKDGPQYLKRLIGLPGETLEIRDNKVYIDDKVLDEPYLKRPTQGKFPPLALKSGEYFVMGDNRDNSTDSRAFGSIPSENIYGRVKQ